jgi:hypothetical protein
MPPPAATSASAPPPIAIVLSAPVCARSLPGDVVVAVAVGVDGTLDGVLVEVVVVEGLVEGVVEERELVLVDGVLLGLLDETTTPFQLTLVLAETGALRDCARTRFCDVTGLVAERSLTKTRPASMPLTVPEAVSVTVPWDGAEGSWT